MITIIYRLIVAMVISLVGWNLFTEENPEGFLLTYELF